MSLSSEEVVSFQHSITHTCVKTQPRLLGQLQFTWEHGTWGPIPRWLSVPNIAAIESLSRSRLQLPADQDLTVSFFSEGAFNKLYTVTISGGDGKPLSPQYIFRVTIPVEPFYKTASEVATISYLREHTSIPVPRVIAHSSTAENELRYEWILMEKVAGVALAVIWDDIGMETKIRETKVLAGFVRQLRDLRHHFAKIGNLYFREDIDSFKHTKYVSSMEDGKYVLGPIVTPYMFAGACKRCVPRELGPYPDEGAYITALILSEQKRMELWQSAEVACDDFDEDLAEDADDIAEVLQELQVISYALFPSLPCNFRLYHQDLSLANILVDPETNKILGIVDWECVGVRPHWEDTYPLFLIGPTLEEEIEPLAPGDTDAFRVERWENWEKMRLRSVFDLELGGERDAGDGEDETRRELREQLDWADVSQTMLRKWIEKHTNLRQKQMLPESG